MRLNSVTLLALAGMTSLLHAQNEPQIEGQKEYQMNCAACHLVDTPSMGPSLFAIAKNYPAENKAEFIAWAKAPGKKDPALLQMPSMAHVGDEGLAKIHHYTLKATQGIKKEKKKKFPNFKEPKRELPYVVRTFLPNTSPASAAIVLEGDISLCFDSEACRLRYAWTGSKTMLRGFRSPAALPEPYYQETSPQLWSFANETKPESHGYRLVDGVPEFHYSFGDIEIREKIANGPKPGSFVRSFTLSGISSPVTLDLSHIGNVSISSNKGKLKGDTLRLTASEAKSFSLTISQR
ncbi:c-type cytochrome [Pelagicoccus mobilis]|uniref:Cytochrome c domain-containing protein n=1 Tax=Pelagicoccus mobilis TaxID=415221 RepID=A0A934RT56_9BACT|nr:cytochrome c [Pelagicoccus mobilis]MBK1875906.1 hypothetical protein [Pelagicoccus mobilis]